MKKIINKNLEILNDIKIAHLGLCTFRYPENSLGAYQMCVDKNISIELDVHVLKDNTLVVIHDDDTFRTTGKKVILKDAEYKDIKNLKLGDTDYKIPTFSEVLNLVNGKVLLDIELKSDVFDFRICHEIVKYLDNYDGDFVIKSFNPMYIWWFKKNRPNYIRGLLVSRLKNTKISKFLKLLLFNMSFNFLVKPDFVAFDYRYLPNKKIDKLYENGLPVLLFTVKGNENIDYGYTGIIYESE